MAYPHERSRTKKYTYDPESCVTLREPLATGRTGRLKAVMAAVFALARCQPSEGVTLLMLWGALLLDPRYPELHEATNVCSPDENGLPLDYSTIYAHNAVAA